mmetsp:Transcript_62384/g.136368  ORF Transcript_62384/g.136368 Transcript_62384/m.136368 type:complete len:590 (+) Transcript_62384:155-1924(+)|eukprot:CAMPEP_0206488478 /NCGR_PEP_ID=MMETSP0324_2-20121206/42448_1 /ASSEMBLY_ACC=CAM_ASM_000836 /TAXON_ID=2866 /ORGANISM="Crypthecodinium cohnii, Strain Seligo" /LENGTH=589 /DNA_ID=CAMNT_0053967533 /DNA_START=128 /DNA_END=1897 /DNA_ORIENTATION=+
MAAPPPASGSAPQFASLYVGDLHPDVTEAMLYEIFNAVGPVGSIRVCRNSVTRKSLGYGYVNFHNVSDAERALETLNYSNIKGRACRVMWSQRDPSLRKSGLGNIFVKNLDKNIDNKALFDTFSLFGKILSCKVALDANGKSRGYGFVHYETEEAAKQAIESVNGMQIGDLTVEVCTFVKRDERDPNAGYTNLYIKNFPQEWDEPKLLEMFKPFGKITSSVVMEDKLGRKFAFVNFEDAEDAAKAVKELNGQDLRSEEKKAASTEEDPDNDLFYVGKALTKAERAREFANKSGLPQGGSKEGGVNLYIKNLDEDTDEAALKALFEPFGTVTSAYAVKDERGNCKGFGFVSFSTADEATKAVTEMHLKVVKGKPLYVGLAERKEERQERLRQRYNPSAGMGGKGKGPGMGGSQMGGNKGGGSMMGPMGGKGGPMMGGGGAPAGPMVGPMGMGGKGGPMMPMTGPMMMGGKMGMMPQMMMGKGMMPMNMMRPMMPMTGMLGKGMPTMPTAPTAGTGISAAQLAAAPPQMQKQILGEKLYPAIARLQPDMAGKITGMMLEMDNSELLILLETESALKAKVDEAMRVLSTNRK